MLRSLAALLALAAAATWVACVLPARQARDRARADFARARQERERLRLEIAALERGTGRERQPADAAEAARSLRRSFLRATAGLPLSGVSLSASRAGGASRGAVTRGTLTAEGRLPDLLRVSARLLEPALGVRIRRVTLFVAPGGDAATKRIEIECSGEGAGS